ncbi:MAG TPA: NADH-quinone oxidoreductase subunit J [Ignavibacteriaceae bacterium]|nr:NADH-quinone oxidoreductase subunit J [Ignavibacteriaceae bacterium]
MNLEIILFIFFAGIAAVTSVLMITRSNIVIAALFLVLNFAALAGLYLLLNAQFIAVTQVIVYAGAIMVLFLLVIMLLKPEHEGNIKKIPGMKIFALALSFMVFVQFAYLIFFASPSKNISPNEEASINAGKIETIGRELFTNYVLPFEAAGFLLLAATIGALILAKKKID